MNWLELIRQFEPIGREDVPPFAPAQEMEQAIAEYNKALDKINTGNTDIALITLRKLASAYPLFSKALLLLGYCQARDGYYFDAEDQIRLALQAGLPEDLKDQASESLKVIERLAPRQNRVNAVGKPVVRPPSVKLKKPSEKKADTQVQVILKKTGRHAKVKIASKKERQEVMREGESQGQKAAKMQTRRLPAWVLRIALPILAGAVILSLVITASIIWLPGLIELGRERHDAQGRLEWLIERLDEISSQNPGIQEILDDYREYFDPDPSPTSSTAVEPEETTDSTTTTQATTKQAETSETAPATTTATTADPDETSLRQADHQYKLAADILEDDFLGAAEHLLEARHLLVDIPNETAAQDVSGTAGDIGAAVENMINEIAYPAAAGFFQLGRTAFNAEDYQEALIQHLKVFELYPGYYTGGGAYYCGRCYQLLGSYEAAKPYFDYVIEHYKGRDIAASAAARLAEMGY